MPKKNSHGRIRISRAKGERAPFACKKVMVFGTFDGLHKGHLSFFRQAKRYGDYLIAIIARNSTVWRLKGHLPIFGEKARLRAIKRVKTVDKAVLGHKKDYFRVILREKPKIICLGYDQKIPGGLTPKIKKLGIKIYRLKPYKPEFYKSSKLFRDNLSKTSP